MSTSARLPARFADLKRQIADLYPDFQERVTQAWGEIIAQLKVVNADIAQAGPDYIPQVNFADLDKLEEEEVNKIRRRGSVIIRDVVHDAEAIRWKTQLEEFVKTNPDVIGVPENDKQFFMLYWTKPQVEARSHPNMLKVSVWLNNLYHPKTNDGPIEGVDLSTPLTYADRFRIRRPGISWVLHPPHVDGGTIERWEDPAFRECFSDILSGNWRSHDPYELKGRLNASTSRYDRPSQASVFRTFQGWLAMSETAPTQGTLRVYPDVLLSNSYLILRPFFRPKVPVGSLDFLNRDNWEFDISSPEFPGIYPKDGGYYGPEPTPEMHPHLELEKTMTSVPKVYPGDTVFWHCDVVHSVELEHTGTGDSAVMYIPAVPLTPLNQKYVERQRETFLNSQCPPDFPKGPGEATFTGVGKTDDILSPIGRRAMGLPISVA
ncbi:hypothetical protein J132_07648 [Termitomyces sp. J132]|nr:hypothetical protein H2248_008769 [Termitomyces sp. 'cryptogamus']KNZ73350.1 hypothetical protein J132_07648 [Termitomyces sp. J132]